MAETLLEMLEKTTEWHLSRYAPESLSKYDLDCTWRRNLADASLIRPISALDSDLLARRSLNLSMNTDKLQAALGKPLPSQAEGLHALHADLDSGLRQKLLSLDH